MKSSYAYLNTDSIDTIKVGDLIPLREGGSMQARISKRFGYTTKNIVKKMLQGTYCIPDQSMEPSNSEPLSTISGVALFLRPVSP